LSSCMFRNQVRLKRNRGPVTSKRLVEKPVQRKKKRKKRNEK